MSKSGFKLHPREAIDSKIIKFAVLDEDQRMILKRNHYYYYRIQRQLGTYNKTKLLLLCHMEIHGFNGRNSDYIS